MRRPARAASLGLAMATAVACGTAAPLSDPAPRLLRQELGAAVGVETARRIELPIELDDEATAWAEAALPALGSRRARLSQLLDRLADLHLEYVRAPTRDASAVLRTREANCLAYVHLFVALARRVGLDAVYVEVLDRARWDHEAGSVVSRGHVVAGIEQDGDLGTYDFLPYRPAEYRRLRPIDDRRALAHHLNNLGAEALLGGAAEAAETPLRQAMAVDPGFVEARNNLGVWELRQGRLEEAAALFRGGLEMAPEDVPLLGNLARLEQRLGRVAEADALLRRIARLRHENPFFQIYLGDAALEHGEPATALAAMREALGLDPGLPEAHLGMARAYFALGEVERTRHHLARARRLDPGHPELARWEALVAGRLE